MADIAPHTQSGRAGELHQRSGGAHAALTTRQAMPISDDQNSLRASIRGPVLLEDFVLREKINHFGHERIPERVVHARDSAAHGWFELTDSLADVCRADVFQRVGERTPLFARFSLMAGNAGSTDMARDVRSLAAKFYTEEGNWTLVGNNIPVFFITRPSRFPRRRSPCASLAAWCWTATSTTSSPKPSRWRSVRRTCCRDIDFSNDTLLQGRSFSYLGTQLKRLGGRNFAQIPVKQPRCPMYKFQCDDHMQTLQGHRLRSQRGKLPVRAGVSETGAPGILTLSDAERSSTRPRRDWSGAGKARCRQ